MSKIVNHQRIVIQVSTRTMEDWLLEGSELDQLLNEWTDNLVSTLQTMDNPAIFGIRTRGVPLGRMIQNAYEEQGDQEVPFGILDITLYRDDLSQIGPQPVIKGTECMFDVNDREILLVDDVIFSGRTIRAALDEVFDFGRPAEVRLAVLVDRGHRELPIEPNMTGKQIDVPPEHMVRLRLKDVDDEHGIHIEKSTN